MDPTASNNDEEIYLEAQGDQPGDENQTPGDSAEARPDNEGDQPKTAGDDAESTAAKDPLVRALMSEDDEKSETVAAKAKTDPNKVPEKAAEKPAAAKPETQKPDDKTDKATPTPDQDDELAKLEREAAEALPDDDWGKLSHKGKSVILSGRRAVKVATEQARQANERYQTVEKFVSDAGLSNDEYVMTMGMASRIKRGDKAAISELEQTLTNLRKFNGIAEPAAAPQMDDDLEAFLKDAEDFGLDTSNVRSRFTAKPAAKTDHGQEQQKQPTGGEAPTQGNADAENQAIIDALTGFGIADPVAHLKGLMEHNPDLRTAQQGTRLKAVMAAHATASQAQPARKPSTPPLSTQGRRVPVVPGGGKTTPTTKDPLKHALG